MKEQELNTHKYIMDERNNPFACYYVTKYWKGESSSGGPIIAQFYDKEAAEEYVKFKNKQLTNK